MNTKSTKIPFRDSSIYVIQSVEGRVQQVCLDDLCTILSRTMMMNNGQAMKLCPTATKMVIRKKGRQLWFIKPYDSYKLLNAVRKDNKMVAKICDELEEWFADLPVEHPPMPETLPSCSLLDLNPVTFNYQDQPISFKAENGITYVNATQMGKTFEKNPREWLLLVETIQLRQTLVNQGKSKDLESQIITKRGQQGATWIEERLAMEFSRWLSPEFSDWCNMHISQLMTKGYVILPDKNAEQNVSEYDPGNPDHQFAVPTNFKKALQLAIAQQEVIERQHHKIEGDKSKVDFYEDFIESREWFKSSLIAEELRISVLQLNRFLAEQGVCRFEKKQWVVFNSHAALQCQVPYLWTNRFGKTYGFGTVARWTQAGREYILDLWRAHN